MNEEDSIFGTEPDRLMRLMQSGLEEDEADAAADARRTTIGDNLTERPGMRIGRYKLLRVLGEGGMGLVYLAEQEGAITRQVAVKLIKPGMDSKRVIARFETERQALALLDHPSVAQVYDAGTTDSGRPYFAMEYVKGSPITEYCDRHRLTIEDRLRLFQQVCAAVHHAHQKGIIHRDIKPSNILVSTEGDAAIPKIIDFGVAKATGKSLTERTLYTEDSQLLGTPEYMSPEQADMANEDIDTRSDIYSLGVLLYVLLSGIMPYDAKTFRQGGVEHVRKIIRDSDPKTPSTRLTKLGQEAATLAESRRTQIATLAKRLHKELEWIPLKAMRKERAERYRSATELADDIGNYLNGAPLIAGPPGTLYRFKKFVRRNTVLSAAVLVVAVTLILGLAATTVMYNRSERALQKAQAIAEFLTKDVLAGVSDANAYEQNLSYVLNTATAKLDEGKFKNQPLVEASIRNTLGWTYKRLYQLAKAESHFDRALQIYEEQLGKKHVHASRTRMALSFVYQAQHRWHDAYRIWAGQGQIGSQVGGITLGILYTSVGKYQEAEACFLKKIEEFRRREGEDAVSILASEKLARVYCLQGRYQEAERLLLKVQGIDDRDPEDRDRLSRAAALAGVYRNQGRYQEAEQLYKTTMEKQRRVWGAKAAMGTMVDLAQLYTDQGHCDKANELFEDVHEIILEKPESARTPWHVYNLAVLRTKQDRFPEAETLFKEAEEEWNRRLGEFADDHPELLRVINGLGVLRRQQQHYDEAESLLRQALEGRQRRLGPDHPACFESMHELGVLSMQQARYKDAEQLLLNAFHGRETKLNPEHPHTLDSLNQLVNLYESWLKPEEAQMWRARLPRRDDTEE